MVVEDSSFIAKVVKILLKAEKINCEHISEGGKVMEYLNKKKTDLVVLDLMMPNVSGKDVFLQMKADPKTKDIPVLILTAKTDALRWEPELEKCDKFMTKPFDNDQLIAEIKKLLKL